MRVKRDLVLGWGPLVASVGAFAAITAALAAGGWLTDLDLAVERSLSAYRPAAAEVVASVLNRLGQGLWLLGICAAIAAWLAVRRWRLGEGRWRAAVPLLYVFAAAVLLVPTVRVLKDSTGRGAPSSPLPPEITVQLRGPLPPGEYAAGYPGGHAANTVVWYGVLLALVVGVCYAYGRPGPSRRVRVAVRLVPPVVVLFTTTYLSYHWFSDGLAGLALGLAVDRGLYLLRPLHPDRPPAPHFRQDCALQAGARPRLSRRCALGEQADPAGAYQEPDDDQHDAPQELPAEQGDDPTDHEDHCEQP